jgi:Plasmid pRiA4b ORF-3-like protein
MPTRNSTPPMPIYQLKVALKHSKPPIWRRIQVRAAITLYTLHQILQIAMGWTNSHLHQFIVGGVSYGEPDREFDVEVVNEKRTRLHQIVRGVRAKFVYEYDFGDSWEHDIVVEKVLAPEAPMHYPRCLTGRRSCPPEDVGGIWGYRHFLDAIQHAEHPAHDDYREWIGGDFDPEAFDLEAVNQALQQIR